MGVELDRIHNPTSWPNCCGETGTNSFPANCICEFAFFFPPIIFWVFIHEKTIILLLFCLFFFAHICVCSCLFKCVWVVVCVWMCVHVHVCVCAHVQTRGWPFHFVHWGRISKSNSVSPYMASLSSLFPLPPPLETGIIGELQPPTPAPIPQHPHRPPHIGMARVLTNECLPNLSFLIYTIMLLFMMEYFSYL